MIRYKILIGNKRINLFFSTHLLTASGTNDGGVNITVLIGDAITFTVLKAYIFLSMIDVSAFNTNKYFVDTLFTAVGILVENVFPNVSMILPIIMRINVTTFGTYVIVAAIISAVFGSE